MTFLLLIQVVQLLVNEEFFHHSNLELIKTSFGNPG